MFSVNSFIQQSLSPAVAISGIGLLILSLSNRMGIIGSRVRELNRDLRKEPASTHLENYEQQIKLFIRRARLIRNALFLLYSAVSLIVLTEVCIALGQIEQFAWLAYCPIFSFLLSLMLVLIACIFEMLEVAVNIHTMKLEIQR